MEDGVKQRIREIIDVREDSVNSFSDAISVKQTTLNDYLNKGKTPSWAVIRGIVDTCTDISLEWLIRGEGDMYKKTTELPPVDVSSDESIEHSAEVARLVKEKNALAEENQALREENDRLQAEYNKAIAQLDYASSLLRERLMMAESAQKVG